VSVGSEVHVGLGARSYVVRIAPGLVQRAGAEIADLLPRPKTWIVTERTVAALHLETFKAGLTAEGIGAEVLVLPPGEATKSWAHLTETVEWLLSQKVERRDVVIAFGGGVIGDLVGFAAAILRRGVRFVQVPTSLLAQVDSSVGGKTGINTGHGKNLVGAFHQPSRVLADIDVLGTLTPRDFLAGYGEVVKYGLLGDVGFFEWLEANGPALAAGDDALRAEAVRRSVQMKADIVARDETEQGDRALLNLGHTFCHALEAATGYSDRLLHGEGVAIGCALAFELSARLGLCSPGGPEPRARPSQRDGHEARSVRYPGRSAGCRRAAVADGAGQEGGGRAAPLHPRARDRRGVSSPPTCRPMRCGVCCRML
jgi:3-dehydroquinate synthase